MTLCKELNNTGFFIENKGNLNKSESNKVLKIIKSYIPVDLIKKHDGVIVINQHGLNWQNWKCQIVGHSFNNLKIADGHKIVTDEIQQFSSLFNRVYSVVTQHAKYIVIKIDSPLTALTYK